MKVCVETSRGNKGDKIVDRYPCLKCFNLIEIPYKDYYDDDKIKSYIEIESLGDILMLMDLTKHGIVFHRKSDWDEKMHGKYDCDYIIEIYDDWRE